MSTGIQDKAGTEGGGAGEGTGDAVDHPIVSIAKFCC